jgi:hypothetical protein
MANRDHLKILTSGVENWNLWRAENDSLIPDLTGADLNYAYLHLATLAKADLTGANLTGADPLPSEAPRSDTR